VVKSAVVKFRYIDAVRGIAILLVLMVHTNLFGTHVNNGGLTALISQGARGVQLFFIASAFTLFHSYSNRYNKELNPDRNFFIRRFFRIAPVYYLGIVYYLCQEGLGSHFFMGDREPVSIFNIIANVLFLHGINPNWINSIVPGGWSITVEMTFYLLIPLLFRKIKNLKSACLFLLISIVIMLVFNGILKNHPFITNQQTWKDFLFFYLPSQLPVFAMGIVLYFLINSDKKIKTKNIFLLMIFILALSVLLFPFIKQVHIIFSVVAIVFVYLLSKKQWKIFVNPFFCYLGKISYSMYISHFAVLYYLGKLHLADYIHVTSVASSFINYLIRLTILIALSSILATILNKTVEQGFQKLGKKIIAYLSRNSVNITNNQKII
jgi:peptidoglycan/LPS O-acetylase OafA/YrhL